MRSGSRAAIVDGLPHSSAARNVDLGLEVVIKPPARPPASRFLGLFGHRISEDDHESVEFYDWFMKALAGGSAHRPAQSVD
jgi:hypothetical protein